MQVSLDKQKTLLIRHSEPTEQQPTAKSALKFIGPIFIKPYALGTSSEKLYFQFCDHCRAEPELLCFKGTVVLLGCYRPKCERRLFRIETA